MKVALASPIRMPGVEESCDNSQDLGFINDDELYEQDCATHVRGSSEEQRNDVVIAKSCNDRRKEICDSAFDEVSGEA